MFRLLAREKNRSRVRAATARGRRVQTRSQAVGAAHGEHVSQLDEREIYSSLAEEAQFGAPTGKRSHKERLTTT
ncbi:hypothetical protein BHE74_00042100 [Ensete ventricosum]|nr:hypothetical protein GW17_00017687 [Ensete ventricosum]RWW51548.1 hypothetical protein BHE74_00042100 [Ensete ventricosum]